MVDFFGTDTVDLFDTEDLGRDEERGDKDQNDSWTHSTLHYRQRMKVAQGTLNASGSSVLSLKSFRMCATLIDCKRRSARVRARVRHTRSGGAVSSACGIAGIVQFRGRDPQVWIFGPVPPRNGAPGISGMKKEWRSGVHGTR